MRSCATRLRLSAGAALLIAGSALLPAGAGADSATAGISEGGRFDEQDGESLYRAICQGCHMPAGQGAVGAAAYPALARNPRLASGRYPAYTVLHGRKAMPPFKGMLSDSQVAAVTNYVRTHLDNNYPDALSAADVKSLR